MFALERLRALGAGFVGSSSLTVRAQEYPRGFTGGDAPTPLRSPLEGGTIEDSAAVDGGPVEQAVPVALDPHMVFERMTVGPDGVLRSAGTDGGGVAGVGERLIYSNTLGIHAVHFPANQPVSDDIATTAPNGCTLTRYRFKVLGKVLPDGASGAYTVNYALYSNCPNAIGATNATRDIVRIPGTEGVISFADDGPRMIEHIVPALTPAALPTNVYLGIRFNRSNCGTVVGAPASIGYSGDILDFPGFPCNGYLGGFPELPHASFWLEMFGSDECADAFVAYKTQRASRPPLTLGANVQGVDDFKLIADDCAMIGYEVAVKGVGLHSFDLRRQCNGTIIEGTQRTFLINASAVPLLQTARFHFDPPILLNTDTLFLGFKSSSATAGPVNTGISPIIGESGPEYFIPSGTECTPVTPAQGIHGAIQLAITCAGQLPLGACCDPYLTECNAGADAGKRCFTNADCAAPGTCEAVCRVSTEFNCPFPPRGQELRPSWQIGEACEPNPFGADPCGVAACCHKRPNPQNPNILDEVCENLTKNECEVAPPLNEPRDWQLGNYCGLGAQTCSHVDCIAASGSCYVAHATPGCSDPFCCREVCSRGSEGAFCCNTAWDSPCVTLAEYYCSQQFGNQCAPDFPVRGMEGALAIPVPGSRAMSNLGATTDPGDPGFCCNAGTGTCIGGTNVGAKCVVGTDCNSGVCTERVPEPWAQALGTVWLKFAPPAGVTTVGVSTCTSNSPALDSVVQVFTATDRSSQLAACNSLVPIGCNDDYPNCGSTGRNSRLCLHDLVPGQTYYIELAAKTPNRLGQYIVNISTSCSGTTLPCTNCPVGEVDFVDPPSGVVDARRPNSPNHQEMAEGIVTFLATGPFWTTADCWSVCQSPAVPASIQIAGVEESPPGTYTVQLNRAIVPGAVTMLGYTDNDGHLTVGRFIAHPANVNANSQANAFDILDLVDYLNGAKALPWGLYSGDLDHSGVIGPTDILTLIDLLNGTNGYTAWYGTALPEADECP